MRKQNWKSPTAGESILQLRCHSDIYMVTNLTLAVCIQSSYISRSLIYEMVSTMKNYKISGYIGAIQKLVFEAYIELKVNKDFQPVN